MDKNLTIEEFNEKVSARVLANFEAYTDGIIKNIDNQEDKEIQFGKLLFNIVQLSMLEKIDPEIALNEIVNKYIVKLYKIKAKLEKEKQIDKEKLKKLWEELSSEY